MNSDDPNKPEHYLQESSFDREVTILKSNPSHIALMNSSTFNPINMWNPESVVIWKPNIPFVIGQITEYYLISSKNILIIRDKQQESIKETVFELRAAPTNLLEKLYELAPGLIKELTDVVSIETSKGFQAGLNFTIGSWVDGSINLDLGSRRTIYSNKGTEKIDRIGLDIGFSFASILGFQLEGFVEAQTDPFNGVYDNIAKDGERRLDGFFIYDKLAANGNGASLTFGGAALFGFQVHIDLGECLDVIRYIEDWKERR
jgi:hypothetical protein